MISGSITVRLQEGVLDAEGRAVEQALRGLGFETLRALHRTRVYRIELDVADRETALRQLTAMAAGLLANPVLETFEVEVR